MTIHFLVGRGTVPAGFLDGQVHLALIDPPHLPGWSCEVTTAADATTAVDRQCRAGASVLKVTLNSAARPVPAVEALAAVVGRAHEREVLA